MRARRDPLHGSRVSDEQELWNSSPSQWLNLGHFSAAIIMAVGIVVGGMFFPLALALLIVPAVWLIWRFLVVRCQRYTLTSQRLRITSGVINQHIDEVELYRVKDSILVRPWWMRLTGLSTIQLDTSDRTLPRFDIPAMRDGIELREILRKNVEYQRDKKRVREMDFDDAGDVDVL